LCGNRPSYSGSVDAGDEIELRAALLRAPRREHAAAEGPPEIIREVTSAGSPASSRGYFVELHQNGRRDRCGSRRSQRIVAVPASFAPRALPSVCVHPDKMKAIGTRAISARVRRIFRGTAVSMHRYLTGALGVGRTRRRHGAACGGIRPAASFWGRELDRRGCHTDDEVSPRPGPSGQCLLRDN